MGFDGVGCTGVAPCLVQPEKRDHLGEGRIQARAKKLNFTMGSLARIKPPSEGRQYLYDARVSGLAFSISATGAASFYWVKKVSGRTERLRLGGFPELSVDTVRGLANKHNAAIAKGDNPADSKRKQRGEWTMGALFDVEKVRDRLERPETLQL